MRGTLGRRSLRRGYGSCRAKQGEGRLCLSAETKIVDEALWEGQKIRIVFWHGDILALRGKMNRPGY